MKIYLIENGEWKLFDDPSEEEFKKRNIIIGDHAKIGNYAKIGDSAKIGYSAEIGDSAKITKSPTLFSKEYILIHLGILPDENGNYLLYKSVNPDQTSFYTSNFKYQEGQDWENQSLHKDQSVKCGIGCHFTTYERAVGFAEKRLHIILSATININDILSVYRKVRVKKYTNLRIIKLDL